MTSLTRETHTSVAYYAFREPFFALTFNPPGVQVYQNKERFCRAGVTGFPSR